MHSLLDYLDKEAYLASNNDITAYHNHGNDFLLQQYQVYLHGTVADFGCNNGACTWLITTYPTVKRVIGIDLFTYPYASELQQKSNYLYFSGGDMRYLPLRDNCLDAAVCFHTLEHLYPEDIDVAVAEMSRLLKPGAHLIICVPYLDACAHDAHKLRFDEVNLGGYLKAAGFRALELFRDNRHGDYLSGLFIL